MHTINYKLTNDEIKELEKYNIYLSIYNQIKETNISDGIPPLNINTLDNYSLVEIKKLRNKLNKDEKKKILIRRNSK